MDAIEAEWRSDLDKGITLNVEESIALWHFLQHSDTAEYWLTPEMSSIAQKAKSFGKYGPWDEEDA